MKTIAVIGAGYVGLVTGACLAQKGNRVIIIEKNKDKITALLKGNIPFYEPMLDAIVAQACKQNFLSFVPTIQEGLAVNPDIIFCCVGTPSLPSGAADLSYVFLAAQEIGAHLMQPTLVVNKSTVPVGTTRKIKTLITQELDKRGAVIPFAVASNPEFLKEGSAINDFLYPDRVVVGIETEHARQLFYELYKPFIKDDTQLIAMNIESAELTKYAANSMLALRISFMNQLGHLADKVGADIEQIKQGMAKDPRIGPHFLNAGIGYGGSCFPKDVRALAHIGTQHYFPMTITQEIENVNQFQRIWFINRINTHFGPSLMHKTVGIWGLAFKPETDDLRCAPSLEIIDNFLSKNTTIIAYDPVAADNAAALYPNKITFAPRAKDVLEKADFLVILAEWKEFLAFKPEDFLLLKDKIVFDGRNCFDPHIMQDVGVNYFCVGRNVLKNKAAALLVPEEKEKQIAV